MAVCSIEGCGKPTAARGMCTMHYKRTRKHGDPHHITRKAPPSQRRHGASWVNGKASPEYNAWASMKSRCQNPKTKNYARYGGRGIAVCEEWSASFESFLKDVGRRPSKRHSLGRIDNDGNYEPSNCRWETVTQQQRNKSSCRYVEFRGSTMTVAQAAEEAGANITLVRSRLKRGWSVERSLS
jgi:hypothetical protein